MPLELVRERWVGAINRVTIGATQGEGGTREFSITVGGETTLPFLFEEGDMPHPPVVAMEVLDGTYENWPDVLKEPFKDVLDDPAKWAGKCVREYGARLISLKLISIHPEFGNRSADEAVRVVKSVLETVKVPLIIIGSGDEAKDNEVLAKVSEAAKGERCLMGLATEKNYKTLVASCLADGHNIITSSPIDINIAKQVNILASEMGLGYDRIVMDPTTGSLGYGMEYGYSIMERGRLAALNGDRMLSFPVICMVGQETWRAKEAKASSKDFPQWGSEEKRGPFWEMTTAISLLHAGADILVLRHPKAKEGVEEAIKNLMAH